MRYRFFTIPAIEPEVGEEELNRFCAGHRVIQVERQFVADGGRSYWSFCVSWQERGESGATGRGREKIDYREVLSAPDFALFARLRTLRKALADAEGVPAYALFSNEQLAEMVRRRVDSLAALAAIEGVGKARVEKYGEPMLAVIRDAGEEAGGEPATP